DRMRQASTPRYASTRKAKSRCTQWMAVRACCEIISPDGNSPRPIMTEKPPRKSITGNHWPLQHTKTRQASAAAMVLTQTTRGIYTRPYQLTPIDNVLQLRASPDQGTCGRSRAYR